MVNIYKATSDYLEKKNYKHKNLTLLLELWEGVVSECEEGYNWDLSELHNESWSREILEEIRVKMEFRDCEGYDDFIKKLEGLDNRFRVLLREDVKIPDEYWWSQGVLKKAGEPYRDYMKSAYNIDVDEV